MTEIILYPTETLYALGVDALDPRALEALYVLKGREERKPVSWLVKDIAMIGKYAEIGEKAALLAERHMPGPLTLVLKAKPDVSDAILPEDRTISFRVSSDPLAAGLAREIGRPITCTSANVSGKEARESPYEILAQFGEKSTMITRVIDDGLRSGIASTVVRIIDDTVEIIREGAIPADAILKA